MRHLVGACALGLCLAPGALAQDPRGDLFAGYALVRSDGANLHGGEVSLAYHLSRLVGLVLDLDAHRHTAQSVRHTTAAVLAGPRLTFHAGGGVTAFLHALVGAVRDEDSVSVFGAGISAKETSLGGAAGGGLDLGRGRFGARVQADYRVARRSAEGGGRETKGDPRIAAGLVLRFGTR